ncbi:MAG: hypothetical protein GY943_20250, partial [Chloroflexi bacterium]|nr:hypothetical protein [Chloroflexota bacterium]
MTISSSTSTVLHADAEHPGIRTVVMLSAIVLLLLAFFLMRLVFQATMDESPFILVCGAALPIGLGAVWLLEISLKRLWPSGRNLVFTESEVKATNRVQNDLQLKWGEDLSQLNWHFNLKGYPRGGRERRIPASWLCLASQLQQGERRLVVYAYVSPQKAATILENTAVNPSFHPIEPKDVYKTSLRSRYMSTPTRPDIPSKVLAGK